MQLLHHLLFDIVVFPSTYGLVGTQTYYLLILVNQACLPYFNFLICIQYMPKRNYMSGLFRAASPCTPVLFFWVGALGV